MPLTGMRIGPNGPRGFGWRGRRYVVCAVLAQWVEVLPVPRRRSGAGRVGGMVGADVERVEVWRVEAMSRVGRGVYEIAESAGEWCLRRVVD